MKKREKATERKRQKERKPGLRAEKSCVRLIGKSINVVACNNGYFTGARACSPLRALLRMALLRGKKLDSRFILDPDV